MQIAFSFWRCPWKLMSEVKVNIFKLQIFSLEFILFDDTLSVLCRKFTYYLFVFLWRCCPTRVMTSSFLRFLDHTQRCTTVGRTPLDAWTARRRDLYLTTHNTVNRQTSMPPVGFEPTISVGERPQTYALDRAAIGIGFTYYIYIYNKNNLSLCRRKTPLEYDDLPIAALMNRVECKKYKR